MVDPSKRQSDLRTCRCLAPKDRIKTISLGVCAAHSMPDVMANSQADANGIVPCQCTTVPFAATELSASTIEIFKFLPNHHLFLSSEAPF
jgi:hypothetical protein